MESLLEKTNLSHNQYLEFMIDGTSYGAPIDLVNEIIEVIKITPVPNAPHFIRGVINLRGKIIPAMDLRLRLGMQFKEYGSKTCIIIVNSIDNRNNQIGLIVDMVSEVIEISESEIENSLSYQFNTNENFIDGIGKYKENPVILLNIFSILKTGEMANYDENSTNLVAIV